MTYEEMLANARKKFEGRCAACPVCDGRACGARIPGPGAKGSGKVAAANFEGWQRIRLNMDTIYEQKATDTSAELFGQRLSIPLLAGPVGAVANHYGPDHDDASYNSVLIGACARGGVMAMTGDGINPAYFEGACNAIMACGGAGIPTVKPWDKKMIQQKIGLAKRCGTAAIAMDVDAAGLPFLRGKSNAGAKSAEELAEIISLAKVPFILKGIMTVKGAEKALRAGASAIVVSNHGGRVLDGCPATAEVLPEIVQAVGGRMKILVDGGIRSGADMFKAFALGADACVICRPFVTAVYGGGEEGVALYLDKLKSELEDAMQMCGANSISEITREMVRL